MRKRFYKIIASFPVLMKSHCDKFHPAESTEETGGSKIKWLKGL
jgi:hypothetical protein